MNNPATKHTNMKIADATPAQREAIETDAKLVLALAGPGSGKTATVVARIKRLLAAGVPHEKIAAITYTNAGARELEARIRPEPLNVASAVLVEVVGGKEAVDAMNRGPRIGFCGTLHAFCLRLLRQRASANGTRIAIVSPESALDLLASKAKTLNCKTPLAELVALKAKGRRLSSGRIDLPSLVVSSYHDDLREAGIVDFDSILTEALAAIPEMAGDGFDYLFVDEVQDSAAIDWLIYHRLRIENKFFVGDPDQSIFGFRGASLGGILHLAAMTETLVVKLEENFRSHVEITTAAQNLIERNESRVRKATVSVKGPGGAVWLKNFNNEGEEIGFLAREIRAILDVDQVSTDPDEPEPSPHPSIAVLARTNAIAHNVRTTLAATGIPVATPRKLDLPRDWALARALVEVLAFPENDTLAQFYLAKLFQSKGATEIEARNAAHAARTAATAAGKSLNRANLGFQSEGGPKIALASALTHLKVLSLESRMLVAEHVKALPSDGDLTDLALAISRVANREEPGAAEGVEVLTMHAAKGREFDVVFVAGFEDEVVPGRAGRLRSTREELEEERRLAYVAITRARKALYVLHADSRVTPWGSIGSHNPSRFIREMLIDAEGAS